MKYYQRIILLFLKKLLINNWKILNLDSLKGWLFRNNNSYINKLYKYNFIEEFHNVTIVK